jgi:hypothetical protein
MSAGIRYDDSKELPQDAVLELYESVDWSSASKPDALWRGCAGRIRSSPRGTIRV